MNAQLNAPITPITRARWAATRVVVAISTFVVPARGPEGGSRVRRKAAALVAGAAVVSLLAGVTLAGTSWSVPNEGVFWACYDSGGNVKFIDYSVTQRCPKGWMGPVNWSEKGEQGLVGPAGPQGEQGPAGLAGADGAPGAEGPAGADGMQGPAGPAGADGAPGAEGPAGPQGAPGPAGPAFIGSACTRSDGSSGTVEMNVATNGVITLSCTGGGGGIACQEPAPSYPNMTVECDPATGTYLASCVPGFADVNSDLVDGCEVNLMTDPANCGAVGNQIPASGTNHATYGCVQGTAVVMSCDPGWTDANLSVDDGCETAGDPDGSGNIRADAVTIGTLVCDTTAQRSGSIANAADNDWYLVQAPGVGCALEATISGTGAVFDVQTDRGGSLNLTSLSLTSGTDYTDGSPIYIRVHASGDGPYDYTLTLQR
jgi:hypothetical protein